MIWLLPLTGVVCFLVWLLILNDIDKWGKGE